MTKFRYIGEYPEGKSELFVLGQTFSPGAEIELTGRFEGKARNNRFFEQVAEMVDDGQAEEPRNRLLDAAPDKGELIAKAEALGIKIDKRWSVEKIATRINEASNGAAD